MIFYTKRHGFREGDVCSVFGNVHYYGGNDTCFSKKGQKRTATVKLTAFFKIPLI